MAKTGISVLLALSTILILLVSRKLSAYVTLRQASHKHGCQPPPKYPHKDILLGLDLFFNQFEATKRGDTASAERARFSTYGKTFETNSWGTRCIETMDVKNVKAVLAQSFDKFGVEPLRLRIGEPFIGKGVFSTDGSYWKHSRELMQPMFARAQISDFAALDVHLNHMMAHIPRNGSTVDLQALLKLMVRLTPGFLVRSTADICTNVILCYSSLITPLN